MWSPGLLTDGKGRWDLAKHHFTLLTALFGFSGIFSVFESILKAVIQMDVLVP